MAEIIDTQFFRIAGTKSLKLELDEMSATFSRNMVAPAVKKFIKIVERKAIQIAPKDTGTLKANITSRLNIRKGSTFALIGVLNGNKTDSKGQRIAKYAAIQNSKTHFLEIALESADSKIDSVLVKNVQKNVNSFHASKGDQGKI